MKEDSTLLFPNTASTLSLAMPLTGVSSAADPEQNALDVMTDFRRRVPVTVVSTTTIKEARALMMRLSVGIVFVVDPDSRLVGLVFSYDIQSEKPLRYLYSIGCTHKTCRYDDIRVSDIMDPIERWHIVNYADVRRSTVGDIVSMFRRAGSTCLIVVEPDDRYGRYVVRGLFSAAQVSRQTGINIDLIGYASTFLEIEEALSGNNVRA